MFVKKKKDRIVFSFYWITYHTKIVSINMSAGLLQENFHNMWNIISFRWNCCNAVCANLYQLNLCREKFNIFPLIIFKSITKWYIFSKIPVKGLAVWLCVICILCVYIFIYMLVTTFIPDLCGCLFPHQIVPFLNHFILFSHFDNQSLWTSFNNYILKFHIYSYLYMLLSSSIFRVLFSWNVFYFMSKTRIKNILHCIHFCVCVCRSGVCDPCIYVPCPNASSFFSDRQWGPCFLLCNIRAKFMWAAYSGASPLCPTNLLWGSLLLSLYITAKVT